MPLGEIVREHLGLLESDPPETVRRRLGQRAILGMTLGLEAPVGPPSAGCARPAAPGMGRLPRGARGRATRRRADRRPALGRGGAPRPPRSWCTTCAVRCCCWQPRGRSSFIRRPTWGRRGRDADTLWLEALSASDAARMVDELIPAVLPAYVRQRRRRAGGGQSVLRRGARSDTDRPGRARATERRLDSARASRRLRRSRHGAGGSRRAHRLARAGREGGAAGGRRDRPHLLVRPCLRAAGGRRGGPSHCSRSATSSANVRAPRSSGSASS